MRKRTFITILVFTALALFSRWLVYNKAEPVTATNADARSLIDYQLEQFKIKSYGSDGKLLYSLNAPEMSRHALTAETVIIQPRLLWPQQSENRKITLKANNGTITGDMGVISLRGNVIARSRTNDQQTTIIRTESLDFYQENRMVSTDAAVNIEAPGVKLNAVGMIAQLEEEIITLKQQVSGQYETQQ